MRMWGFILFLMIFLAVLFGGHFFIYFSLVTFFTITAQHSRTWLAIILSVGSVSFIASSFLVHYVEHVFARIIYTISGLWLAVGWQVIMSLIAVWCVVGVCAAFGINVQQKYVAIAFLFFAVVYSGYGVWCAFHPRITHVTLTIKDLPDAWKNKTAVQLSDVHLGHVYGAQFLSKIVEQVNNEHPDIVFVTGDLFDGMDTQLEHLANPFTALQTTDGVYFVTGNHETYIGIDKVADALAKTPLHTLNDVMVTVDGVQITGMQYPLRGEDKDVAKTAQTIDGLDLSKPAILLYHNPSVAAAVKNLGFDVQLSGHTHSGQLFPFQLITRAIYGRYHHGLSQENDFSLYTSIGVGTWGPAMRTSGRPEIVVIHFK